MKFSKNKSPIYYYGNKYYLHKEIEEIISKLEKEKINSVVEPFGGSGFFSMNINSEKKVINDYNSYVVGMYNFLKNNSIENIKKQINNLIQKYNLSKKNKDGYLKLRADYNESKKDVLLFVLMLYSFNHLIRFNKEGEFNVPFGENKSSITRDYFQRVHHFKLAMDNATIMNVSFEKIPINKKTMYFLDPPYINTNASYNESNRKFSGWKLSNQKSVIEYIKKIDSVGSFFIFTHSYDEGVIKQLSNFKIIDVKPDKMIKNRREIIITNFQ